MNICYSALYWEIIDLISLQKKTLLDEFYTGLDKKNFFQNAQVFFVVFRSEVKIYKIRTVYFTPLLENWQPIWKNN